MLHILKLLFRLRNMKFFAPIAVAALLIASVALGGE
jgi:hypothetical protein